MNSASPPNTALEQLVQPAGAEGLAPSAKGAPAPEPRGVSIVSAALISAAVSCTFVVSGLMLYDSVFKAPPRTIATVDIDAIVSAREMALVESLSRPGTTDIERGQAYDAVASFGRQIEKAIQDASVSCNCDVLVRGAVVGRAKLDLTEQIASSLGIAPAAVAVGRERIRAALSAATPTSAGPVGAAAPAVAGPAATPQPFSREARP
jgi:hypothetical protein